VLERGGGRALPWALGLLYVLFDVAAFYANLILWTVFIALCMIESRNEAGAEQRVLNAG
jgi:hypothetical protein